MLLRFGKEEFHPQRDIGDLTKGPVWLRPVAEFCSFWYSDKIYWEAFTSGSTSAPKRIQLSREKIEFSARKSLEYFQFTKDHGMALAIPASSAGGFMLLARAFMADLDVLLLPPGKGEFRTDDFPDDKKWFLPLLPLQLFHFLKQPELPSLGRKLCGILLGGGPMDKSFSESLTLLECPVFHSYGMTETASHIALRQIHPGLRDDDFQPLSGIHTRRNQDGCLEIMAGILTDEDWLTTNDLAEVEPDGRFRILGRADFTVNSGGLKIQPEVEKRILENLFEGHVSDFDLLGIPDERLGEKLVMVCYEKLPAGFSIPAKLEQVENPNQRHRLPRALFLLPEGRPLLPGGKTNFEQLKEKILGLRPVWNK